MHEDLRRSTNPLPPWLTMWLSGAPARLVSFAQLSLVLIPCGLFSFALLLRSGPRPVTLVA